MSEPRIRHFELPNGFVARDRSGTTPAATPTTRPVDGPSGTKRLPVVRNDDPPKAKTKDRREYTGEPRPMLGWGFWPKMLGLAVLLLVGIAFLALNDFELSAFAAMFVIGLVLIVIFVIVYLIAKASKKDDDHSNPTQGPDKVEDHRGH